MGTMTFQLPAELPAEAVRDLERACVSGGPDNMPWPTELRRNDSQLTVHRSVDESGFFVVPWPIDAVGRLMTSSATLMERPVAYQLLTELARGKVNQVRGQAADWVSGGLQMTPELQRLIQDASRQFGQAVTDDDSSAAARQAGEALATGYRAARDLVQSYVSQVFSVRHERSKTLETTLGCRLGTTVPSAEATTLLKDTFNGVTVPLAWSHVEAEETTYRWKEYDDVIDWAGAQGLSVSAGPLIDFSSAQLPAWLWLWERDIPSMATFMCRYVQAAVTRYRSKVRRWQLTAASNCAPLLGLGEDELLGLTYRLVETARQVDPNLEFIVGVAQPWGEYMALADRTHSPFIFADTLIRSGLNLAALDVELVMGLTPRGSYCRDLLEASRLLDLYALLGVPLRVTLGYPSSDQTDPDADPEIRVDAGRWGDGFTPQTQADWADAFSSLALCKPPVLAVQWPHFSDDEPHQFPHVGLFVEGKPKPALARLRSLRESHLK
jgi:hypothetical protein